MAKRAALLMVLALVAGCGASRSPQGSAGSPRDLREESEVNSGHLVDRVITTRATLRLESDDPPAVAARAREVVNAAGGYVEQSMAQGNGPLWLVLRVPTRELEPTLSALETMARLKERRIMAQDVTAEMVDMEARLRNLIAVRDRLRSYLGRAESVAEIIEIERELARLQGEIDAIEARLKLLRSSVELAEISVQVDRSRTLGPLGLVIAGLGWVVKSLFVIQ